MSWSWKIIEEVRDAEYHRSRWRLTEFGVSILVIVLCLGIPFCCWYFDIGKEEPLPDEKIENIVRVFMHESHRWTLVTELENSAELKRLYYSLHWGYVKIFNDVPTDKPMWANVVWYKQWGEYRIK